MLTAGRHNLPTLATGCVKIESKISKSSELKFVYSEVFKESFWGLRKKGKKHFSVFWNQSKFLACFKNDQSFSSIGENRPFKIFSNFYFKILTLHFQILSILIQLAVLSLIFGNIQFFAFQINDCFSFKISQISGRTNLTSCIFSGCFNSMLFRFLYYLGCLPPWKLGVDFAGYYWILFLCVHYNRAEVQFI